MAALKYLRTLSDEQKDIFNSRMNSLSEVLKRLTNHKDDPLLIKKIEEIGQQKLLYEEGFIQVQEFMRQRNIIVKTKLDIMGPQMRKFLQEIVKSAFKDQDAIASYYASISMGHLLLARLYMTKFLDTNDFLSVDRFKKEINELDKNFSILERELQNTTRRKLFRKTQKLSLDYREEFYKLVNIIKERNTVITNVMDKIGPEVGFEIEKLKLNNKETQDTIGPFMARSY